MLKLLTLISYGYNQWMPGQKLNMPSTGLPRIETINNHKNTTNTGNS